MSYLEIEDIGEEDSLLRKEVHRFAEEEIRPASIKLDRMDPADVPKKDSQYWDVFKKMHKLGYHRMMVSEENGGLGSSPLACYIVLEECCWGSIGLGTALGVDLIPVTMASILGTMMGLTTVIDEVVRPWMKDTEGKYAGCWAITEPEHGSDTCLAPHSRRPEEFGRGQVTAVQDGDEWVINGSKSAWVSSALAATHALLHVHFPPDANLGRGGMCIMPLNIDGVTKGAPIDKLGYRDNPQGELVFDNARIPEEYMLSSAPDLYPTNLGALVCSTSTGMNAMWTGVIRAAYEEGRRYAKTRVQGGKPLIEHSNIKLQIYHMFEKFNLSEVYGMRMADEVWGKVFKGDFDVSVPRAYTAQIVAKRSAYEVAHEALQIHGGYGLTKEFLIEKLFRDAREGIIMDYTTDVLGLAVAEELIKRG